MNQLTASEYFNKMGPNNSPDVRRRQKKLKTNSIQNLLEKKLLVLSCSQTELNWPTDGAFFKPDCSFFCFIPFRLEVQIAAEQFEQQSGRNCLFLLIGATVVMIKKWTDERNRVEKCATIMMTSIGKSSS